MEYPIKIFCWKLLKTIASMPTTYVSWKGTEIVEPKNACGVINRELSIQLNHKSYYRGSSEGKVLDGVA